MKKIGIWGSCVTRDLFGYDYISKKYILFPYISRTTIYSSLSSPITSLIDPINISDANFEGRRCQQDIKKNYWSILNKASKNMDILIIDLIDERHNTYVKNNMSCTVTQTSKPFILNLLNSGLGYTLKTLSPKWESVTLSLAKEFAGKILYNIGKDTIILIHKAYYAESFLSVDRNNIKDFNIQKLTKIRQWNNFLENAYNILINLLGAYQIAVDKKYIIAGGDSKWDLHPYHYDSIYYREFYKQICSIFPENV